MRRWAGRQLKRVFSQLGGRTPDTRSTPGRDHEQVISLNPAREPVGRVLLAYIIDPFLDPQAPIANTHTHQWESWCIAQAWLTRGYAVDVISFLNRTFVPTRDYDLFFAARTNLQRISQKLNPGCLRVVHLDTAHWLFNNSAAYNRLLDTQRRRGVTLDNAKMVEQNWALEHADLATILGNQFTIDTYAYANKPIHRIPISAPAIYDYPEQRDVAAASRHFVWFGSSGFVHKGLDLVLEAFAGMPDLHLHVCGPFDDEKRFLAAYNHELRQLPNVHAHGWVDVAGATFRQICEQSIAIVYPSASEGGGGSVISCMHQGLIPVVSYETSVDTGDFGVVLDTNTIPAIRAAVQALANEDRNVLDRRARASWSYARTHHTRETFARDYDACVDDVLLPAMQKKPNWHRIWGLTGRTIAASTPTGRRPSMRPPTAKASIWLLIMSARRLGPAVCAPCGRAGVSSPWAAPLAMRRSCRSISCLANI